MKVKDQAQPDGGCSIGGARPPAAAGAAGGEGASPITASPSIQAAASIVAASPPRVFYSNLLDDLGTNDSFVIDGDGLLLELLTAVRIDWAHLGQYLQLTAAAEQLVASIQQANTARLHWDVVFFDASAEAQPDAAARLAREVLMRWLPEHLGVPVLRFDSWWSAGWQCWLEEAQPALLLLTDLPGTGGPAADECGTADTEISPQLYMQAMLQFSAGQGLQCALLSAIRFSEQFVFAFRTMWRGSRRLAGPEKAIMDAARAVGSAFAQQPTSMPAERQFGSFAIDLARLTAPHTPPSVMDALAGAAPGGQQRCVAAWP